VVDSLEKKTLVERKRSDQDRRTVMVYLTELGRELIAKVFPRHAKVVTRELGFLTDKEKDALEKLLRKFK